MLHDLKASVRLLRAAGLVAAAFVLILGFAPVPGVAAPPTDSNERIPGEPLVGGPSIDDEVARQAALHAWLMNEMPGGALASPLVIRLTAEDQADLRTKQQADKN